MKAEMDNLDCGRNDDLVSFLYDELNPEERLSFSQHMQSCSGCKSGLAAFREVRTEVVSWRDATLGAVTPVLVQPAAKPREPRRSAVAALREFFNLSPVWMKGAVVFASLLFCFFAVLAASRFRSTPPPVAVNPVSSVGVSPEEVNAQVERRVKEELARRETAEKSNTIAALDDQVRPNSVRRAGRHTQIAAFAPARSSSRPLTKLERKELAADLGLIPDVDDSGLVLIGDRINQ
jgi:hypothetical protein